MKVRQKVLNLAAVFAASLAAAPAFAQAPTAPDYSAMVTAGKGEILVAIVAIGAIVFGLTAMMGGVRWAHTWLKKAIKS